MTDTIVATLPEHTLARARLAVTDIAGLLAADRSIVDLGELDRRVGAGASLVKELEAARLEATAPLRNAIHAINEAAKRATGALRELVRDGARAVVDERRRRREGAAAATAAAMQRLQELAGVPDMEDAVQEAAATWLDTLPSDEAETRTRSGTATRREVEIYDPELIPHSINGIELLKPVHAAIRRLLYANIDVPGCRLVEREHVRISTTKNEDT